MSKDMSDMVKDDVKKFKNVKSGGGKPDLPTAMEYTFWGLALLSVAFMIGSMYFVGPNKAISGMTWLSVSVGGMVIFGGLAMIVRMVPEVA